MSSNRKVVFLKLHQAPFIKGAGQLGETFPPVGGKTLENLLMTEYENGSVLMEFKFNGKLMHYVAGASNISGMTLEITPEHEKAYAARTAPKAQIVIPKVDLTLKVTTETNQTQS